MTIHKHDFEAIAALVTDGGTLDQESCDVCRSEFDTQNAIRSTLMEAPMPELTGPETATLRSSVYTSIHAPADRRLRRWLTVASVAAGLLVIIGIGPVLNKTESADETLNFGLPETSMAARAQVDRTGDSTVRDLAPVAGAESAPSPSFSAISDAGVVTEDELIALEDEMMLSLSESSTKLNRSDYTNTERVAPPCLPDDMVYGSIEAELYGRPVVSYLVESTAGERGIERYALPDCQLLLSR